MLIHTVHAHSKNAGLLLVPVWARKRPQLYHNQDTMLRSLGMNTCDFSQQASLLFNKKVDVREQRPLNYPVRIIKGFQDSDWDAVWKNVGLVQNTYTAFAEQLATRDMLVVEDLDEAAVPSSCWEREAQVHGAKKAEQLGVDAALKLLQSMISGAALPPRSVLLICDPNLLTGDFVRAFLKIIPEVGVPVRFFGATPSEGHAQWINVMTEEFLLGLNENDLALLGLQFPIEKPPDFGKLPDAPTLNCCCWKSDNKGIQIPKPIVDRRAI